MTQSDKLNTFCLFIYDNDVYQKARTDDSRKSIISFIYEAHPKVFKNNEYSELMKIVK